MARCGRKWSFITCYFLKVHWTCTRPQAKSQDITFEAIKIYQNDRLNLSFMKDEDTYGKKWPEPILQQILKSDFHFETEFMLIPMQKSF